MKFVDLNKQYQAYKTDIDAAISEVIETTAFINGPAISKLESELAQYSGAHSAVSCASGTDALLLAMMALDVKPGDEIIVPVFSFIATASMIPLVQAKPIFVDVEPLTFNIDTNKIEEKITSKTVGIIGVSMYGQCADYNKINDIAAKNNLWVIEDGAQSFGATYHGQKSCSLTSMATTSFFPAKPLGCYGDGGAIFTQDEQMTEKLKMLRNHGQAKRYHHDMIGLNGRMDTLQAAIVSAKLKHFDAEIEKRNQAAMLYTELLKSVVKTPEIDPANLSSWAQYTIRTDNRDALR
ncbi:DegT/DnrJ/EryC1/StrS family aminotransferase, partial [bacterium]|nr:DegT/DnrJ/EryC1/StrS family aminotransferase [bacterium]